MRTLPSRAFKLTTIAAASVLVFATAALAKMKVIESDAPEIAIGSEWADDATLPVPPGKSVRVLMLPSNVTKVIEGPSDNREGGKAAPWGGTRGSGEDN